MDNVLVRVLYGPYEANGIIRHKIQRIYGLIKYLEENFYRFEVEPSPCLNRLTINMDDRVIYTCDIRYLRFNIRAEHDILCQRIIRVIQEHHAIFSQPSNVPLFQSVTEGMRYQHMVKTDDESIFSVDFVSPLPMSAYQISVGEEDEYTRSIMDALKQWNAQIFTYDYGCFGQEPSFEDETSSQKSIEETVVSSDSTIDSCVCLSKDPPSLYSICYGPQTPVNTETSQKSAKDKSDRDFNYDAELVFDTDEFKDMIMVPDSPSFATGQDFDILIDTTAAFDGEDQVIAYEAVPKEKSIEYATKTKSLDEMVENFKDETTHTSLYDQNDSNTIQTEDSMKEVGKIDKSKPQIWKPGDKSNVQLCRAYAGGRCKKNCKI